MARTESMVKSFSKLDQALKDLVEAYAELESDLEAKHGEDEESLSAALIEALETGVEGALEEHDYSSSSFAGLLSMLTEALEQLDPAAFEGEESEDEEYDLSDVDYDIEEGELEDADLDEDLDEDEGEDEEGDEDEDEEEDEDDE